MTKALVDSGCTNCFMDLEWAKRVGLEPSPLLNPIMMYNVDGSQNREGKIRFGIELLVKVGDHRERVHFLLGKIQSHKVILGHDWLKRHNPDIDWKKAELSLTHCPPQCSLSPQAPTPLKTSTLTSASIPDTCFLTLAPPPIGPAATLQFLVKQSGMSFPAPDRTSILRSSSKRTLSTSPPSYTL